MDESLITAKGVLRRTLQLLREVPAGAVPEEDLTNTQIRIQAAQDALIQNEGEIWLRTGAGKEIVGDLSVASIKLLGSVERLQRTDAPDPSLLKDLRAALGEVELHAKRLNEEIRRRSRGVV